MPTPHLILIAHRNAIAGRAIDTALGTGHDHENGWTTWGIQSPEFPLKPSAKLASTTLALDPAFVLTDDSNQIIAASSDPALLAAIDKQTLDPIALTQDLLFGFMLGARSRFNNVRRLLPGQRLVIDDAGNAQLTAATEGRASSDLAAAREGVVTDLAQQTAQALGDDSAIELSGGYDSRLALALALRGGTRPTLAFTLGTPDSADVRSADAICQAFDLDHHVIDPSPEVATLVDDTEAFVTATGFCGNATSYGWLPNVFRKLEPLRSQQLGGAGGEMATGFFYTQFDALLDRPLARHLHSRWIWYRLRLGGERGSGLYSKRELLREAGDEARRWLDDALRADDHSWPRATDRLYREQRLRQWAGPVLAASAHWYQPITPLLSDLYLDWCLALPVEARNRSTQRTMIRELSPKLADQPWASDFAPGTPKWKRVVQRVIGSKRAPDLGAATVAQTLAGDESTARSILELATQDAIGLDPARVQQLVRNPHESPREIGVLVSASLAQRAAARWANRLSGSDR